MAVQHRFLRTWHEDSRASSSVQFGKQIARYLKPPSGKLSFHCMVIAASRGDGITTAARQAEQRAQDLVGADAVRLLAGKDRPGLAIAELLPRRTVERIAIRAGVSLGLPARPALVTFATIAAFAISVGVTLFGVIVANGTLAWAETRRVLTTPWYYVFAVLTGAGALGSDRLLHLPEKRLERAAEQTATVKGSLAARQRFVRLLAKALLDSHARHCLIVDDFARLDAVSRDVIRQALQTATTKHRELWIIFESTDRSVDPNSSDPTLIGELGRLVLASREPSATAPALRPNVTMLFQLLHLTAQQRRQLAEDAARDGLTVSPGYEIVKDVISGGAAGPERDAFKREWPPEKVRADVTSRQALELLYVLSFSARPGFVVTLPPWPKLAAELSDAAAPYREVLQLLLRIRPTIDAIKRRLRDALRVFTPFVSEVQADGRPIALELSPAIQDVLTPQNGAYELRGIDIVHLFWALYSYERRSPDRTTWLEPQTRHLSQAADPFAVDLPNVAKTFGAALLAVIDACVDLGRPDDAGHLLDRAFDLGTEPGFPLDPDDLRKRSRALYAVSANAELLARAAHTFSTAPVSDAPPPDLLLELFQQATPAASDLAPLRHDEAFSTDLRLRAIWLAFSLQPVTESMLPRDLPLSRTIIDAHLALPLLTQRVFNEADAQVAAADADEWSPAALMSLTAALWCLALADETLTGPILRQIDTGGISVRRDPDLALSSEEWSEWTSTVDSYLAEGLEHGLHLFRNTPTTAQSYALANARSELLVVIVAAAIRVRLTWTGIHKQYDKRLDAVILDGCGELGVPIPQSPAAQSVKAMKAGMPPAIGRLTPSTLRTLAERVAKRMNSIQVSWTALGYPRAAAVLGTRRVQLLAGLPGEQSRDVEAARGDRSVNDVFGFIANLAVAGDPAAGASIRAQIVATTVGRFLKARQFDEKLAAQLCFLSIRLGSSFRDVDVRQHLRYLADSPDFSDEGTGGIRVDPILAAVAEDELNPSFLAMINAASSAARSTRDGDEQARTVIHALRRRLADVVDLDIAKVLRARLDTYELMRIVNSGHRPDIEATLDAWRDRRALPSYAFVLYLLMPPQNTAIPELLRHEVFAVLHAPSAYFVETGINLLANSIAHAQQDQRLTLTEAESADLLHVLRASAHRVGKPSELQPQQAINTLRHLFRLDSDNAAQYWAPLLDLQHQLLKLFDEEQFARLLTERQNAALLRAYYEMFRDYLPLAEELGNGQLTLLVGEGRRTLNAALLRDLFDPDERVRARINALTRNADLVVVLELILEVPDLPAGMPELLKKHRTLIQQADS